VILVEQDDEFAYAQDPASSRQRVEGQPTLDIETIPAGVAHIGAPEAWGNSQGKGIRVAILDSGIDSSHPDLAGNFMGGVSFVPASPTERDDEGHGTFCAGIVGAGVTGAGIVGVAPQAFLYAVKVSDRTASPTLRSLLAGIDWCIENRMHVVNVSLGYPRPSYSLYLMCRRAWEENVLIVASAGNASERSVHYPAALDCVVGVSAIDASNERYRPSNMGVGVNLCAPGVNVLSTGLRGTYRTMSGTSAACPHVSGAAALAWGAHRFSSNRQVWSLLAQSARSVGSSARHGRVRYGLGRVNAHAASSAMTEPKEQPLWGYRLEVGLDAAGRRTAIPVEQRDPGDAR
jgi:subtilisin